VKLFIFFKKLFVSFNKNSAGHIINFGKPLLIFLTVQFILFNLTLLLLLLQTQN